MQEPLDGSYFADTKIGGTLMKWFLPTNEIVREVNGRRELTFAPPLRERGQLPEATICQTQGASTLMQWT